MNNGESAFMRAIGGLNLVAALGIMVWAAPLLAELTREPVAALITPRYSYEVAHMMLTGYEWLVWPAVFVTVRAILTILTTLLTFSLVKRTFSP